MEFKDKEFWETLAKRRPKAWNVCVILQQNGCPKCKAKPQTFEEFDFHYHSTHGIPREELVAYLMELDNGL